MLSILGSELKAWNVCLGDGGSSRTVTQGTGRLLSPGGQEARGEAWRGIIEDTSVGDARSRVFGSSLLAKV